MSGHTFRFSLQENELSSVITQTVSLECTHQELSFEWSHLQVSLDGSGFRGFLCLVKFIFGSERDKIDVPSLVLSLTCLLYTVKSNLRHSLVQSQHHCHLLVNQMVSTEATTTKIYSLCINLFNYYVICGKAQKSVNFVLHKLSWIENTDQPITDYIWHKRGEQQ